MSAALAAVVLAATHLFAGRLRFLDGVPRSVLLSAASGISVAYVALHLLPEVADGQEVLEDASSGGVLATVDRHAHLLLLAGVVVYFTVELLARRSRRGSGGPAGPTTRTVYALSIVLFGLYSGVVGYVLSERAGERSAVELALFTGALAVHFVVNDFGLRQHHQDRYHRTGRWVLAVAVLAGWALEAVGGGSVEVRVALTAFLAGGIVLNVLKEELPEERQSRILPFVAGAAGYAGLLLAA